MSCERIENRLFLEEVQRSIRTDSIEFEFHGKVYSLNDPFFSEQYLKPFIFLSSHQDPRLGILRLVFKTNRPLFDRFCNGLIQSSNFIVSANLLYRSHLSQHDTCAMLDKLQRKMRQHFLDLPTCPCCLAKVLRRTKKATLSTRQINHIYGIFRNTTLSQHPTWFVAVFKLLQTIWESDLEDIFTLDRLGDPLRQNNQAGIDFRDWMGAFLETPIVMEKYYAGKISLQDQELFLLWTGIALSDTFYKGLLKTRQNLTKEELIMQTWHPSRLFPWCLDLDELKDFHVSQEETRTIYNEFLADQRD